jgi:hypothetical protein
MLTNTEATKTADHAANASQPRLTVDQLGRQHLHDSRGRFTKQDGTINSIVAARIEGKRLLPNVDLRSLPYQRYKAIVQQMVDEQGGVEKLSAARTQLIRRFAACCVLAENVEIRIARGEQVSISEHATLSSTLVRLASRLGIDKVDKDDPLTFSNMLKVDMIKQQRDNAERAERNREEFDQQQRKRGVGS